MFLIQYSVLILNLYGFNYVNKRQRIPKGQSKMDNPDKLATQATQDKDKQNKNTTQYVLDTLICKQTKIM